MTNEETLEEYMQVIKRDVDILINNKFTGNIEFKINLKNGGIANMNCGKYKSVKLT